MPFGRNLGFSPERKKSSANLPNVGSTVDGNSPVTGILELIGTYTCVPGSWQLIGFRWFCWDEALKKFEEASHIFCSNVDFWNGNLGAEAVAKTGGFWVGCWVFGLEVGCQPFFLVRCRSGCWLPALLEVSSQQLHCLSVESQNNDPGGLFHVLKS